MKKILLGLFLSIFLLTLVNAATITLNGNMNFNTTVYKCTNSICSSLQSSYYYNSFGNPNSYFMGCTSSTQYLAEYDYLSNRCYVPQSYITQISGAPLCNSVAYDITFTKKQCITPINSYNYKSTLYDNETQNVVVNVSSPLTNPFGGPALIPSFLESFYSGNVKTIVEIKDSLGNIIYTSTQNQDILSSKSKIFNFNVGSLNAGKYNLSIKSYSDECFCSSHIITERNATFIVTHITPPECTQDSDCGESELVNQYCSGDNLIGNYSVPSCVFGECEINFDQELIQVCEYGCAQGLCLPPTECTFNSDCGSSALINKFCKNSDSYGNYSNPICLDGTCEINYFESLIQNCEYGCNNGECLPEQNITCYTNSDCGQSGCAGGANYCLFNDVYQDFIFFTCHNPGTYQSYCSNATMPFLLETCDYSCSNGFCIPEPDECSINSDCGQSALINNYCSGNNLMNNYSSPSCLFGECEINFIQSLNKTCAYGCSNGICLPPTPECSINSDCGIITSSLTCIGNNLTNATLTPLCISNTCQSSASYVFIKKCTYGCSNGKCNSCDDDDEDENNDNRIIIEENEVAELIGEEIIFSGYCGDKMCLNGENYFNCREDCLAVKKKTSNFNWLILILLLLLILILILLILLTKRKRKR